ncbi:hypothetical protein RhiLY_04007 [Ceratobasidium sp. AG-Ba]|nr:hypothetical protein RhiLY_04007 [Ceratobasidium sp. AG-Ba]
MSSTSLAFEFPSTTLTTPFPTFTGPAWITGRFPPSLTITNDQATEKLLADVPFYAVGVFAIGVATFIFVMNRMQRHIFDVLLATFLGFIAAIIDLGQLIIISRTRSIFSGGIFPMRIARELGYAVSFGMRFFFFWRFVALPPRGEIPVLPTPGRANRPSLDMDDEFHSGSWGRWGVIGVFAKYLLLMGAIAVGVTQAIWRLGFTFGFTRFTTVYRADAIMEIALSGCFLLKLAGNIYVSPLTPRWRTVRDYLPVVTSISIGLGIAVGNLMCMRFSESPLGRFLQAIELYILILYVLIATFYGMPVRASMIADALDRERGRVNSSFVGINMSGSMRGSTFRVTPPNVSTPELPTTRELEAAGTNGVPNRLLRPDQPRRMSTAERFANWIQNRLSGRPSDRELDPQAYSNLVRPKDLENGQVETFDYTDKQRQSTDYSSESSVEPVKQQVSNKRESMYARAQTPPTGTSTAVNDTPQFPKTGRTSPVTAGYTPAASYVPAESEPAGPSTRRAVASTIASVYSPRLSEAFSPVTVTALAPVTPLSIRSVSNKGRPRDPTPAPLPLPPSMAMPAPVVPKVTVPPPAAVEPESVSDTRLAREYGLSTRPVSSRSLGLRNRTSNLGDESPIYGLEGIIASLGGDLLPEEELPRRMVPDSATYSPGAVSFMRKQAELDRSVANLQAFSPENNQRPLYGIGDNTNPSVPSLGQESTSLRSDFSLSNFPSPPAAKLSFPGPSRRTSMTVRPGEVDLDDIRFTLAPPRMPAASSDGRQVSFPSTTRGSDILQIQPRSTANSNGTQWDVTSFIGGSETRTPLSATIARPDSQGRPLSYARNQLIRRDTMDTQRLSMVIEALSNGAGTPDLPDEDDSVQDARIVDLRRTPSLSRARIIEGSLPTASSVNSANPPAEAEPAPMPTPAERLAAFRAKPTFKSALPSSPRPTYRAESPNALGRPSPLGADPGFAFASASSPVPSSLQPQPPISNFQPAQAAGQQLTQIPGFAPQQRPFAPSNNVFVPPRGGLRNIRIGGPVGQPQNEGALGDGAFERPRPAPLILAGTAGLASPMGRAV